MNAEKRRRDASDAGAGRASRNEDGDHDVNDWFVDAIS